MAVHDTVVPSWTLCSETLFRHASKTPSNWTNLECGKHKMYTDTGWTKQPTIIDFQLHSDINIVKPECNRLSLFLHSKVICYLSFFSLSPSYPVTLLLLRHHDSFKTNDKQIWPRHSNPKYVTSQKRMSRLSITLSCSVLDNRQRKPTIHGKLLPQWTKETIEIQLKKVSSSTNNSVVSYMGYEYSRMCTTDTKWKYLKPFETLRVVSGIYGVKSVLLQS